MLSFCMRTQYHKILEKAYLQEKDPKQIDQANHFSLLLN